MGQEDGEKWTAAVDLQPTIPRSDRLLSSGDMVLLWIYTKAKLDNIRPEFLLTLKEQFNDQND